MVAGEKKFALKVWLDPHRLFAHQLTVSEVLNALREKNINSPQEGLKSQTREFSIKTNGEVRSLEALRDLIITKKEQDSDPDWRYWMG